MVGERDADLVVAHGVQHAQHLTHVVEVLGAVVRQETLPERRRLKDVKVQREMGEAYRVRSGFIH